MSIDTIGNCFLLFRKIVDSTRQRKNRVIGVDRHPGVSIDTDSFSAIENDEGRADRSRESIGLTCFPLRSVTTLIEAEVGERLEN